MFDFISIVCWAITYILIVFCTKNQKETPKSAIPFLPPILNLSWEISALISCEAFWGHVIWFALSILVFESCLAVLSKRKQIIYFCFFVFSAIIFSWIFAKGGMLISSFVINIIMSVCFWLDRRKLLLKGKILIAAFKGIGTLAATIFYAQFSIYVGLIGIGITALDLLYFIFCIREKRKIECNPSVN